MLKVRVIPTLLWNGFGLVKAERFNSWRHIGPALPAIKVYNAREVDEIILLDIKAYEEGRDPNFEFIETISGTCFFPITVGGGIRSINHVKALLRSGADKVCVNTQAYENPNFIAECAANFGSQSIVVGIDVKEKKNGGYACFSHSGKKQENFDPVSWAKQVEKLGAGEIVLTSIDRDGMLCGYDIDLIREVSSQVSIPVIAAGGAASYEDFYLAATNGASAVSAASMFHFTQQTPQAGREYLRQKQIPVRNMALLRDNNK
jgi:cyclase